MMTNSTKLKDNLEGAEKFQHGSIERFSYLKKHDLENYVKEEAVDPEGDEDKAQEGLGQIQEDYFHLHWISHVSYSAPIIYTILFFLYYSIFHVSSHDNTKRP